MPTQSTPSTEQQKMDAAFDTFFAVSEVLRGDVLSLLDSRNDDDPIWRRAFVRAFVPLIEGFAYSFLSISYANPELSDQEREKVDPDQRETTPERIKTTLKSTYLQLNISPAPDFSGQSWVGAQRLISARDALMHPKTVNCLTYTETEWEIIYNGAVWLFGEFVRLPDFLGKRFGDVAGNSYYELDKSG